MNNINEQIKLKISSKLYEKIENKIRKKINSDYYWLYKSIVFKKSKRPIVHQFNLEMDKQLLKIILNK